MVLSSVFQSHTLPTTPASVLQKNEHWKWRVERWKELERRRFWYERLTKVEPGAVHDCTKKVIETHQPITITVWSGYVLAAQKKWHEMFELVIFSFAGTLKIVQNTSSSTWISPRLGIVCSFINYKALHFVTPDLYFQIASPQTRMSLWMATWRTAKELYIEANNVAGAPPHLR